MGIICNLPKGLALLSSWLILFETSNIVNGSDTSCVMAM